MTYAGVWTIAEARDGALRQVSFELLTRGRKLVVLVGSRRALAIAIANNKIQKRYTWLAHRLAGLLPALNPVAGIRTDE